MVTTSEINAIYRMLRKHMKTYIRGDNLPVASMRGTRLELVNVWEELKYESIVEVGVFKGEFSEEILKRNPQCHMYCVDPWSTYKFNYRTEEMQLRFYNECLKRLKPFIDGDRVTIIKKYSHDAVNQFEDNSLDVVYLDGDHHFDQIVIDIIKWHKKIKIGGMMAIHDYCHMRLGGVVEAVQAFTTTHNIRPWFVTREIYPTAYWVKEND